MLLREVYNEYPDQELGGYTEQDEEYWEIYWIDHQRMEEEYIIREYEAPFIASFIASWTEE